MDDFGNQLLDIEYLLRGFDYGPFGVVAWGDQAEDMEDGEFYSV